MTENNKKLEETVKRLELFLNEELETKNGEQRTIKARYEKLNEKVNKLEAENQQYWRDNLNLVDQVNKEKEQRMELSNKVDGVKATQRQLEEQLACQNRIYEGLKKDYKGK